MKNLFNIVCCFLIVFSFQDNCEAQMNTCKCPIVDGDWWTGCPYFQKATVVAATECINDPLVLVFEEKFEGNSINLDNWTVYDESESVKKAVPRDGDFVHSKQFYKKENIIVEDGKLKIIAKREHLQDQPFEIWNGTTMLHLNSTFEFTSGEVDTKWEFGYGVYEIRCRLPQGGGPGWFPAFWGFADSRTGPNANEIDVFEFWSAHNSKNDFALKEWSATNHSTWAGEHINCTSTIKAGSTNYSEDFHTFKAEFLPWVVRWYVDNTMVKEVYKNYQMGNGGAYYPVNCIQSYPGNYLREKAFPFGPMNIKINLAIEPGKKAPNNNTVFPNSFDVEHVKIYQYTPCQGVININNQTELDAFLNTQANYYNVILGTIINIDNCTLKNGRALRLIAEEINLGTNFKTEKGSFLESSFGPCQSSSYKEPISKMNPNPLMLRNDILNLTFLNNENNFVSILSSTGQVIMDTKINELDYEIKSEVFKSSGVYYVFIQNSSKKEIDRFKLIVL